MTRSEALLKLLALEPETRSRLIVVTGWDSEETEATLDRLVEDGLVTYRNGTHGARGERRYYPKPGKGRKASGNARVLPSATGAVRSDLHDACSGLLRGAGAVASGRLGSASAAGNREAEGC